MKVDFEASALRFGVDGLLPVVVQDVASGAVLMLAYANQEAVERTLASGVAHFFSRSRQALWRKGETSGNEFLVREARLDCDGDAVLLRVDARGPACHRGTRSCFDPAAASAGVAPALELGWLAAVIADRRGAPSASYTARLLAEGRSRIAQKVGEEAIETVVAALDGSGAERLAAETADLLYHLLVLLEESGVPVAEVGRELWRRHAAKRGGGDD